MFGVVDGGLVNGSWGFEGGQSAVGDPFAWFVENCVPPTYHNEAQGRGISMHELLTEKAAKQQIGEHGLVAIEWHNGNRSILVDSNLSGVIIGQTLVTTAEDQYRALLKATAFGLREIIEAFARAGVEVTEVVAAGGLLKNTFLTQLYSDVIRLPLSLAVSNYASALGSAIHAAVAAGAYPDVPTAAQHMGQKISNAYHPTRRRPSSTTSCTPNTPPCTTTSDAANHGPFTVGRNARESVKAAAMCEEVARTCTSPDNWATRSRRRSRLALRAVPERVRPALTGRRRGWDARRPTPVARVQSCGSRCPSVGIGVSAQ